MDKLRRAERDNESLAMRLAAERCARVAAEEQAVVSDENIKRMQAVIREVASAATNLKQEAALYNEASAKYAAANGKYPLILHCHSAEDEVAEPRGTYELMNLYSARCKMMQERIARAQDHLDCAEREMKKVKSHELDKKLSDWVDDLREIRVHNVNAGIVHRILEEKKRKNIIEKGIFVPTISSHYLKPVIDHVVEALREVNLNANDLVPPSLNE